MGAGLERRASRGGEKRSPRLQLAGRRWGAPLRTSDPCHRRQSSCATVPLYEGMQHETGNTSPGPLQMHATTVSIRVRTDCSSSRQDARVAIVDLNTSSGRKSERFPPIAQTATRVLESTACDNGIDRVGQAATVTQDVLTGRLAD